jgi:hypothetical protein
MAVVVSLIGNLSHPLTRRAYSRRVSAPLEKLRGRLAELSDLAAVEMLVHWDQLVMMPADGAATRAQQLGTLARLTHERATAEEIGGLLEELEGVALEELDRDIVRLASRDWSRARRVPEELAVELARAGADGQESWRVAREQDDFRAFAPALERNVELARAYCGQRTCNVCSGRSRKRSRRFSPTRRPARRARSSRYPWMHSRSRLRAPCAGWG